MTRVLPIVYRLKLVLLQKLQALWKIFTEISNQNGSAVMREVKLFWVHVII